MASFSYTKSTHIGHGNRHEWEYEYKASDLIPWVRKKADSLLSDEQGLASAYESLKSAKPYSGHDGDISGMKSRLKAKGVEREQCEVIAREFARVPGKTFKLQFADLVYFDIDTGVTDSPDLGA